MLRLQFTKFQKNGPYYTDPSNATRKNIADLGPTL